MQNKEDQGYWHGQEARQRGDARGPHNDTRYPVDADPLEQRSYDTNWFAGYDEADREMSEEDTEE